MGAEAFDFTRRAALAFDIELLEPQTDTDANSLGNSFAGLNERLFVGSREQRRAAVLAAARQGRRHEAQWGDYLCIAEMRDGGCWLLAGSEIAPNASGRIVRHTL